MKITLREYDRTTDYTGITIRARGAVGEAFISAGELVQPATTITSDPQKEEDGTVNVETVNRAKANIITKARAQYGDDTEVEVILAQ